MTKLPDFAWIDWGKAQGERVWDLLDINHLESAKLGIDPSFKSQVWNLSQNVDRMSSGKAGISPCLTPNMIPYITNRGGPMVGLEALHLQGLPIDELLLTRETHDQEADLAGNAMSTTVVGASMLVALAFSKGLLRPGIVQSYEKAMNVDEADEAVKSEGEKLITEQETAAEHIQGFEQLSESALDLTSVVDDSLADVLAAAEQSVRLCACEGRKDVTTVEVMRCVDCGTTICKGCGGRPEHNYEPIDVQTRPRAFPSGFARRLKATLPMLLHFNNFKTEVLEGLRASRNITTPDDLWNPWRDSLLAAVGRELRFVELKRQAHWVALYESEFARLELTLRPTCPTWLLFAKPPASFPADAEIRKVLQLPVARFRCTGALFAGKWEIALPAVGSVNLSVKGAGELVPSWEARLGLQGETFSEKKVWSHLEITVDKADVDCFDRSIAGTYVLLPRCGTANSALHRRIKQGGEGEEPLYLFLDPSRCGRPAEDSFVFAVDHRRYEYGEGRPVVARLEPSWRPSSSENVVVKCTVPQVYMPVPDVTVAVRSMLSRATFHAQGTFSRH